MMWMEITEWERISETSDRLMVPGGWIVRSRIYTSNGCSVHQIFIEDLMHEWKIKIKELEK